MATPSALIVTLQMDASASAHFTALRRTHFPAGRNWLDAHITLFHALPLASQSKVLTDLAGLAAATPAFLMRVDRLHFLGAGVAYALSAPKAMALRAELARHWVGLLGRQDTQWRGPLHVTVQNKVKPADARQLQAVLAYDFEPYDIQAIGLQAWHYMGGPWKAVESFAFAADSTVPLPQR